MGCLGGYEVGGSWHSSTEKLIFHPADRYAWERAVFGTPIGKWPSARSQRGEKAVKNDLKGKDSDIMTLKYD